MFHFQFVKVAVVICGCGSPWQLIALHPGDAASAAIFHFCSIRCSAAPKVLFQSPSLNGGEHTETFTKVSVLWTLNVWSHTSAFADHPRFASLLYVTVRMQSKMLVGYWLACVDIFREMSGLTIRATVSNWMVRHAHIGCLRRDRALDLMRTRRPPVPQSIREPQYLFGIRRRSPWGSSPPVSPFRDQCFAPTTASRPPAVADRKEQVSKSDS